MEIFCFFSGIAFFYLKSPYPLLLPVLAIVAHKPKALLWFVFAILWCCLHQVLQADRGMPDTHRIKQATLDGTVSSIPSERTQFQFTVERLNGKKAKATVLLSCYHNCPRLQAGDHWRLKATLKRPRNLSNPGSFDTKSWLDAKHIHWTGYLTQGEHVLLDNIPLKYPILKKRADLATHLSSSESQLDTLGILQGLTLGITHHISKQAWELFRQTGTTHLMVISGAHVGLVAGLVYLFIKIAWGLFGLNAVIPAPKIAGPIAFCSAFLYALLAGFGVPTQRALIIAGFIFLRHFLKRHYSPWQAWRCALLVVLLLEPHSVMLPGFYLSFLAVASLLLAGQRFQAKGFKRLCIAQCACLLGLSPLSMYWFSYASINGFVANLLAIPWVGFVVIPLAFLYLFSSIWITLPYVSEAFHASVHGLMTLLNSIHHLHRINLDIALSNPRIPIGLLSGLFILCCLPIRRFYPLLLIIGCSTLFPVTAPPKFGEASVDVLDVSQGLAVVVRTHRHTLIYDTGVAYINGSSMGELAVVPYLKTLGTKHLDAIVISHPDLDHRGGLPAIEKAYQTGQLIVDNPNTYGRGLACHTLPPWSWDGVDFQFFGIHDALKKRNNHSCILKISTKGGSVLLTGDIERAAETYLLNAYGNTLRSDALLIPHHGSKTSSSKRFVKAVNPSVAMVSYGFKNRYRFPHRQAMNVYESLGIPVYNTVDHGMITAYLSSIAKPVKMKTYLKSK